jgi:hypothetical protein
MTIEIAVIKRKARYKGETGFFAVDQIADEEIKRMPDDEAPLWAELHDPKSAKLQRLLWTIAQKLADGGLYFDKNEAMDDLKKRTNTRSLRVGRAELSRIADRMILTVCSELLPDMKEDEFRAELEDILS